MIMNEQVFKPVENYVNENMYNSIFNLDIMNNGIYLSHSLEG